MIFPYGFTNDTLVTTLGLYLQGFGILNGIIFSLFLTKYPKYMESAAYVIIIATIISLSLFYIAMIENNKTFLIASVSILGSSTMPTFFVAYEIAVE